MIHCCYKKPALSSKSRSGVDRGSTPLIGAILSCHLEILRQNKSIENQDGRDKYAFTTLMRERKTRNALCHFTKKLH